VILAPCAASAGIELLSARNCEGISPNFLRQTLAVADEVLEAEEERPQPVAKPEAQKPKAQKPKAHKPNGRQEPKVDRRPFEDRSVEELRDRARELDIEGRSNMSKDELVATLRKSAR
jgi:Rho termination factor, N-terminal domain